MSAKSKVIKSLSTFNARAFSSHHPEIMCITCIDGREKGGGNFDYGDEAIRITEIAAIIPPYKNAPVNTRAKFGFRHLKGVSTIIISGHSFCGGAQTVIHCPDPAMAPNDDVRNIVESIAASGEDLVRLRDSFMKVSEGNTDMAANLLSRHLVLVSLRNISEYPYVDEQIRAKNLDVLPIYHVLKQSTGLKSHLEKYDVAAQSWSNLHEEIAGHMCARPNDCASCVTCANTIEKSLDYVSTRATVNGQSEIVQVPAHIATLLHERRKAPSARVIPITPI
jgi:carbonic anhydrase